MLTVILPPCHALPPRGGFIRGFPRNARRGRAGAACCSRGHRRRQQYLPGRWGVAMRGLMCRVAARVAATPAAWATS